LSAIFFMTSLAVAIHYSPVSFSAIGIGKTGLN
jgi:hypothetical protein